MRTLSAVLLLAVAAIATLAAHDHHGHHHRGAHHSNYCGSEGCGSDCRGSNCGQQSNTAGNGPAAAMRSAPGPMQDMQVVHFLFDQHSQVTRRVNFTDDGIEAITESGDPTVRAQLRKHVRAMKLRLDQRQPLRQWDPLFAAIFEHAGKIRLDVFDTPNGVRIVETSSDPAVVSIIHAHAHAVSGFVTEGGANMHKSHPVPTTGSR